MNLTLAYRTPSLCGSKDFEPLCRPATDVWFTNGRLPVILLLTAQVLIGCGGGSGYSPPGGPPPSVSVTLSSPPSTVQISQTAQFAAVVQNSSNTSVTWQVDSVVGGSFATGTITGSGLFTAPQVIPNPNTVTITAVSVADPTKSASAVVSLTSSVTVSISPTPASVVVGDSQLFLATVTNAINVAVTWQVNGIPGGDSGTIGSIGGGVYFAPAVVPNPNSVTITAVSVADPSKSASATVTILPGVVVSVSPFVARVLFSGSQQFNATVKKTGVRAVLTIDSAANSRLNGQYAFHFEGFVTDPQVTAYPYLQLGSFDADGAGNVTAGTADSYQGASNKGSAYLTTATTITGAYTVRPDNRGTLLLVQNTPWVTGNGPWISKYQFALGSFSQSVAHEGRLTTDNGSGELSMQDPAAFPTTLIQGDFSFGAGLNNALGAVGTFHADGAGNFTEGFLDMNDPGAQFLLNNAPFAGSYTIDANGRGTGLWNVPALGDVYVTFYVVSATRWFLYGGVGDPTYAAQAFQGRVSKQVGGPFSLSSLNGNAVFLLGGSQTGSSAPEITGGLVTADGKGNLNGVFDQNIQKSQGVLLNQPLTGTYTVAANGRGTFNFANENLTMYVVSPNTAFLLQPPPTNPQLGTLEAQTGGTFSDASVSGTFYLGTEDYFHYCQSGVISADGAGNMNGTVDVGSIAAGGAGLLGQIF